MKTVSHSQLPKCQQLPIGKYWNRKRPMQKSLVEMIEGMQAGHFDLNPNIRLELTCRLMKYNMSDPKNTMR